MTKAQALAMLGAMETAQLAGSVSLGFAGGVEAWSVTLDSGVTYSGAQLQTIAGYCVTNGLSLSVIVKQMGVT